MLVALIVVTGVLVLGTLLQVAVDALTNLDSLR